MLESRLPEIHLARFYFRVKIFDFRLQKSICRRSCFVLFAALLNLLRNLLGGNLDVWSDCFLSIFTGQKIILLQSRKIAAFCGQFRYNLVGMFFFGCFCRRLFQCRVKLFAADCDAALFRFPGQKGFFQKIIDCNLLEPQFGVGDNGIDFANCCLRRNIQWRVN